MKKNIKTRVVVLFLFAAAFGLNIQYAVDGYGIKTGKVQVELLAQDSGSGSGGSGGSEEFNILEYKKIKNLTHFAGD